MNFLIVYFLFILIKCEYLILKKVYNKVYIIVWYVIVLEFNCIMFFVYNWLIIYWNFIKLIFLWFCVLFVLFIIFKIKFSKWYLFGNIYIFMILIFFYVMIFIVIFLICLVYLLKYYYLVIEVNFLLEVVEE